MIDLGKFTEGAEVRRPSCSADRSAPELSALYQGLRKIAVICLQPAKDSARPLLLRRLLPTFPAFSEHVVALSRAVFRASPVLVGASRVTEEIVWPNFLLRNRDSEHRSTTDPRQAQRK